MKSKSLVSKALIGLVAVATVVIGIFVACKSNPNKDGTFTEASESSENAVSVEASRTEEENTGDEIAEEDTPSESEEITEKETEASSDAPTEVSSTAPIDTSAVCPDGIWISNGDNPVIVVFKDKSSLVFYDISSTNTDEVEGCSGVWECLAGAYKGYDVLDVHVWMKRGKEVSLHGDVRFGFERQPDGGYLLWDYDSILPNMMLYQRNISLADVEAMSQRRLAELKESQSEEPTGQETDPNIDASGNCGYGGADNLKWVLTKEGHLTISGNGRMGDYYVFYGDGDTPWTPYKVKSITIENGATNIGNYAFSCCGWVTSMTIPSSVTSIGDSAFEELGELTNISIPNTVTSIGSGAFMDCAKLANISIPSGLTSISSYLFFGCEELKNITLPNGVTSIGNSAFSQCKRLNNISIPSSVTNIGDSAFWGCDSLVISCFRDSYADIWANENGFTVENGKLVYLQ